MIDPLRLSQLADEFDAAIEAREQAIPGEDVCGEKWDELASLCCTKFQDGRHGAQIVAEALRLLASAQPPQSAGGPDWTLDATQLARRILTDLGRAGEASLEPGAALTLLAEDGPTFERLEVRAARYEEIRRSMVERR